jgi:hypothetical protein
MATEYGVRLASTGKDYWGYDSRESASHDAKCDEKEFGAILIAREVSEPRIVSIRA